MILMFVPTHSRIPCSRSRQPRSAGHSGSSCLLIGDCSAALVSTAASLEVLMFRELTLGSRRSLCTLLTQIQPFLA